MKRDESRITRTIRGTLDTTSAYLETLLDIISMERSMLKG